MIGIRATHGRQLAVDLWPVLTAIGCLLSATLMPPVPVPAAGTLVIISLLRPRPLLLSIGLIILCGSLATQASLGTARPGSGPFEGIVQLVADPVPASGGVAVDVRTRIGRVRLMARPPAASVIEHLGAGDRVRITGAIGGGVRLDQSRHLRAVVTARSVGGVEGRTPPVSLVSGIREFIEGGGHGLPEELRPLYLGLVIGDDRGASEQQHADMRASGLSHLEVVSGENLSFVMLLLSPVLVRLGARRRIAVVLLAVVMFASITGFEPSILRASSMMIVATLATALGRPIAPMRVIGLGVILILLCDPLLAGSLGFRLSLAATLGIAVLARPIATRLPGPPRLRIAIAVPLAAQIGVAPFAIPMFGPTPLVALPANVLAEPAAALVMMWGCSVGIIAGVIGGPVAQVLQWPPGLALRWIALVARVASQHPSPGIGLWHLLAIVPAFLLVGRSTRMLRRHRSRSGAAAHSADLHDGGR